MRGESQSGLVIKLQQKIYGWERSLPISFYDCSRCDKKKMVLKNRFAVFHFPKKTSSQVTRHEFMDTTQKTANLLRGQKISNNVFKCHDNADCHFLRWRSVNSLYSKQSIRCPLKTCKCEKHTVGLRHIQLMSAGKGVTRLDLAKTKRARPAAKNFRNPLATFGAASSGRTARDDVTPLYLRTATIHVRVFNLRSWPFPSDNSRRSRSLLRYETSLYGTFTR